MGAQATIGSILIIKEGMITRMAGVWMSLFTFIGLFAFSSYITWVPMSLFAGVLLFVGWNSVEKEYFVYFFRRKWYKTTIGLSQAGIIILSSLVTVLVDLNVAVLSGTLLFYILKRYHLVKDVSEQDYEDEIH